MTDWIRKYWRVILLLLLAFPFLLNYIITNYTPFDIEVAGEPKDWLSFWGTYISSILSFVAIYIALESLSFQIRSQIANVIFKIVIKEDGYYLEITNNGNSVAYDIIVKSNDDFNNTLGDLQKAQFCDFQNKKFILKPNEVKYAPITTKITAKELLEKKQSLEILDLNTGEMRSLQLTEEELSKIKQTELVLSGSYMSLDRKIIIDEKHSINKTNFCFIIFSKNKR